MASVVDTTAPLAVDIRVGAKKIGVSQTTMRRLVREQLIRSVRAGRKILIPETAIAAFLSGESAA